MRKSLKRFFAAGAALSLCALLCSCGGLPPTLYQYAGTAMGTLVQQSIYSSDRESADGVAAAITESLNHLEQESLSWRVETSEVYAINQTAGSERGILLSEEMTDIIRECVELWRASEGAFDVTMGSLARLWNIDEWAADGRAEGFSLPDEELLQRALSQGGCGRLRIEPECGEGGELVQARAFLPEGMQLDLGAVGKGIALDRIADCLSENRVSGAVISVGGSVLTYGVKSDGTSWKVGVTNPMNPSENIGILSLEGQWCVSTSGDYERYVEIDGVRYHHIFDPVTGMPSDSGVRGVTILTGEGLLGDGLSTACFVLGVEKGLALVRLYDAEALFVTDEGELVMTQGMEKYFQEISSGL